MPCSHVAHIYRGPRTESVHPPGGNPHQTSINHMRLAETWMDEYKEYYYIREPQIRRLEIGDISEQKAIRDKLQCKSFKWFMETVAYDMTKKFPLPPKNKVWGEVIFFCSLNQMIILKRLPKASKHNVKLILFSFLCFIQCINQKNQVCLDVRGAGFGQPIGVSGCHHQLGNQVI